MTEVPEIAGCQMVDIFDNLFRMYKAGVAYEHAGVKRTCLSRGKSWYRVQKSGKQCAEICIWIVFCICEY